MKDNTCQTPIESTVYARIERPMESNGIQRVTQNGDRLDRNTHMAVIVPSKPLVDAHRRGESIAVILHRGDVDAMLKRREQTRIKELPDKARDEAGCLVQEIGDKVAARLGTDTPRPGLVDLSGDRSLVVEVWSNVDYDHAHYRVTGTVFADDKSEQVYDGPVVQEVNVDDSAALIVKAVKA